MSVSWDHFATLSIRGGEDRWCTGRASAGTCGDLATSDMPVASDREPSSAGEATANAGSRAGGVACKYFLSGCCTKGENCAYVHDFQAPASQLCTHYLKGSCVYGNRCRYVHSKAARSRESHPAQPPQGPTEPKRTLPETRPAQKLTSGDACINKEKAWGAKDVESKDKVEGKRKKPACAMEAAGRCARGERCPFSHQADDLQELQAMLGQRLTLSKDETEREEEQLSTGAEHPVKGKSESPAQEDGVPCGICLDVPVDNRYGLLNCNHAFCLKCIRSWRASRAKEEDNEGKAMARACPMCRVETHLIVPSIGWPTEPAERDAIAQRYKEKLASTDCSYFNFGDGECPFGTSCLYRHQYKDGTLHERKLRARLGADGNLEVVAPVKLSSFLDL